MELMAKRVVELLIGKKFHISFAESCTGGLAAARLVEVPDASKVFDAGFVTYANEAKVNYLGVLPESIAKYGVVSEEVAGQMAVGAAKKILPMSVSGSLGLQDHRAGQGKSPSVWFASAFM